MCWATPALVKSVSSDNLKAIVDYGDGIQREVINAIPDENIQAGDTVLVHAGVIISKIDKNELEEQIEFLEGIFKDFNE
ncbi:HypC/HybG/HupF family hydrogenase formation chaperone [Fervidicoccus fontis]|uniref:Hydrogenase expression/formation protein HypC n=2 Tax=Fervidicoccus fontis TaxID=683846 RepID=I0A1Z5_FERFK|nr:HypC/HybG/HupF family hydrogenase formation chaperone [Fervidicoccus fontis]AFH43002.1 hydrogenase expression/formation protein HypC [Fervidicoccus fontis Kam940]MBE9391444.1 HypC/HybG/HupF family hydrogenase formation chaperone [Fervidicoccus fontis]PMB78252.1 MAG: hydrogenase expression/formation protein HypC [Fervidicoccus fontis]HEW63750.1 hydrogenase expression/formation protein HypC [Fervidicoccus fontis]